MPKPRRRGRRKKKVVRRTFRCPNCNRKLQRVGYQKRYLCRKCDIIWTSDALRSKPKLRTVP